MRLLNSFMIAFSTYSRIPMPKADWSAENRKYSMCFFPMIGVAVGLALWLWLWVCEKLVIGSLLKGAIGALLPILITGGIHMDGFMDTMDAMASCQSRERKLEILKDSHTGAFAVIGCAVYLLVSAGAYSEIEGNTMLPLGCIFVLSRALSALMLNHMPKANPGGMLSSFADAAKRRAVDVSCCVYICLCVALLICFCGWLGLVILALAGACLLYYRSFSMKNFGGVTGDLAGWFVQLMELVCLLAAALGGKIL